MLIFQGVGRTNGGELKVIALAVGDAIPAGSVMHEGLAISSDGYLYVVIS